MEAGGGTPLEDLPSYQGDEQYDDMPPMRPQGRQMMGAADSFHLDDDYEEEYIAPRTFKEEDWMTYLKREGKVPFVAGLIYILINLEFFDEQLIKYIPRLFNSQCEITLTGIAFKGGILAVLLLLAKRFLL